MNSVVFRGFVPVAFILAVASCSDNCTGVTLTGKLRSEFRTASPFNAIALQSSARVYVTIGDTTSLKVEADENVIDLITTDVRDGRLMIGTTPGFCNDGSPAMTIWVQTPSLKLIDLSGSGNLVVIGQVVQDSLAVSISGSGAIDLDANIKMYMESRMSGSGTISLRGLAGTHVVDLSGSGVISAFDMVSTRASVDVRGSGIARLTVQGELNVNLSGSGLVQYRGEPTILHVSVTGRGKVEKHG